MAKNPIQGLRFRELFDAGVDAMIVVDGRGNVAALNLEAERLFGWAEAELLGEPLNQLIPSRFRQLTELRSAIAEEKPGLSPERTQVRLFGQRRDGVELPIELTRCALGPPADGLALIAIRDLTKWRQTQEMLFREKEQASVTLASIADAIITTDIQGMVTYLNPTAERLTGWRTTEALGQPLGTVLPLIFETTRQPIESISARCLAEGRAVDLVDDVLLVRRDGTEVAIGDSAAPLRDRNSAVIGVVLVFHDVTERRRTLRKLSHEATHDSLTGLVGRHEFERRLTQVLSRTETGGAEHALCYLDLDRFKPVNDLCGHEAGDNLLKTIGRLLTGRLRNRDTVARLGGDEFGILLEHCSLAKAEEIAGTLQQAIQGYRFLWAERSFSLGASIGVVSIPAAGDRAADVLRAADDACYTAKAAGGNRVHVELKVGPGSRRRMETRRITQLTEAVEKDRFQLYSQAIVPLAPQPTARPRCEILLRLPDEHGGVETLGSFLPYAERHRLIPAIDRWVVRQTVALLGVWHRDHPDCELPLCSINLSASSLDDLDLIPALREYLTQHHLPPEALCFEIAEAAALGNFAQLVRLLSEIRAAGCGLGLDDFGSGLASFAHLKALPVDYVKIGGHYVRRVADDPVYGTLVRAVNDVGRIMGIVTIAEEVESETVLQKLQVLGVGYVQGHAVAQPTPLIDATGAVALPCIQRSA